jgi:O-antigen/teichoic acid export membrane protein
MTEKENLAKTLSKNSLFTVIYNVWYLGSRLVLTPIILSYVTIQEYGLWSYCFVVLSYLALTAFGFNSTYIRYTADYRSRNENDKISELISTGLITMMCFSGVLFCIFWFVLPWLITLLGIDPGLHQTARGLLLGTAAIFVMNFSLAGFQYVLEGEQRIALVRTIHLAASVIEITLIILFFEIGLGVFALLWAYVVRLAFTIVLCVFFAYRVFPFLRVRLKLFRKEALRAFWGFGNQMNLLGLLSLLINSVDRIFITRILHLEAVGLYEIGRKLPNIGLMLPSAVAGTLMPAASHLEGSNQRERLKRLYLTSTRYLMMLSSIPYAFLIFFAPQIIETWVGPGYAASVQVMQILAFGTFINLFTGIGTACVRGIGKPRYEIQYMTVSAILILVLALPLIHRMGIPGAAWAYSLGQTVGSIYFLMLANRLFEVRGSHFLRKVLPPVVMMFALGWPVKMLGNYLWAFAEPSRWLKLAILAASGLIYAAASLLTLTILQRLFFSSDERQKISSLPIPGPLSGIWKKLWRTA